jgi:hypothetical protein
MKRFFLLFLVFSSFFALLYFGYEITKQNELAYSPQFIFNADDQKIIRINRIEEFKLSNQSDAMENVLLNDLSSFSQQDLYNVGVYASAERSIIILDKKEGWNKKEYNKFNQIIKRANVKSAYKGRYLCFYMDEISEKETPSSFQFTNGDVKASYNIWSYNDKWIKTDVYNLSKGFFEYRTLSTQSNIGVGVQDLTLFSSVLPENISSYAFYSRFYAEENDSIYRKSPMSKWVNAGFVLAKYDGQEVMITDNKPQQTPSLLLIDASKPEDDIDYTSEVKVFHNIQLTADFPKKGTIYLIEVEDKTVITEDKKIAEKISLNHSLGETLALNPDKKEQFFKGLPTTVHYRMVNAGEKRSKTWKNKIVFEVVTLPPGKDMIMTKTENWSYKPTLSKIKNFVPIKDHLRGGASLFVYDDKGNYDLISQSGNTIFKGSVDEAIVGKVQVIDIFDNDKKQLLFKTLKKVYVLALNGEVVSGFPYVSQHNITTNLGPFRWANSFRCIFGNNNGEIVMLNQNGGELNIIQASTDPLTQDVYALNKNGNLRSWFVDKNSNTGLAYLEMPAKAERLSKINTSYHIKKGGDVYAFSERDGQIKQITTASNKAVPFAEGKIISLTEDYLAVKSNNQINFFNLKGKLISSLKISFNEVGAAHRFILKGQQLHGVYDYLVNNYYLYDETSTILKGFPKETRSLTTVYSDKLNSMINIFTVINGSVVCYKEKIET